MRCSMSPTAARTAASEARDDDAEEASDGADDGLENASDAVDYCHDAGSDGLEQGLNLFACVRECSRAWRRGSMKGLYLRMIRRLPL